MAQSDYVISDQDGASFLVDINGHLQAIATINSGATEPTTTYAYQLWADTASGLLKQRNAANDGWINKGNLADVDWGLLNKAGGTMTGLLNLAAGADIASASTVDLTAATGNCPKVTGTTAVEAWTMNTGQQMKVIAGDALPLTYHATTNNIEGGASYTCAAGDIINLVKGLDGVIRVRIEKQDGTPVVNSASIIGPSKNLAITNNSATPNSQVDIDADEIILKDSSGRAYLAESVNLTANIASSGANGLDTGVEANSTWYYLWVIYNGTTVASLISASSTAPTLPSGYTYKALMGAIYNGSGGDFIKIYQSGNKVDRESITATSTPPATTYGSVSLATSVPPTAKMAKGNLSVAYGTGASGTLYYAPTSADDLAQLSDWATNANTSNSTQQILEVLLKESQVIYIKRVGNLPTIYVMRISGWEY